MLNKGRLRPEQKPDFGVKFRAKRTQEHIKKREQAFAIKPKKAFLFRDVFKLGKIKTVEKIPANSNIEIGQGRNKKTIKMDVKDQIMLYSISYRRMGWFNWFMNFIGFGTKRILVDDKHIEKVFDDKDKETQFIINDRIYFRERGGLLILSGTSEQHFIDEINTDADYENAKGFVSDFPRRLSNLNPSHAIHTDTLETEQLLEEKSKRSFVDKFRRGG